MYGFILGIHNLIRWAALILGIVAAVLAWTGWLQKRDWKPVNQKFGSFFSIAVDLQFLTGLLLYLFFSPLTRTALQDFGSAMGVSDLRFFALEHPFYMLLALIFSHLGSILPRRAKDDASKFRMAAIWISLAVLLILFGIPWARPLFPGLG